MRELVLWLSIGWAVSIRTACGAIGFDRSTFHYQSRRTDQAAVANRIKEICETRVRYGYRRVHVLLDREGWGINVKKVYRLYRPPLYINQDRYLECHQTDGLQTSF